MNTKRIAATILWFVAGWTLATMVAYGLSTSSSLTGLVAIAIGVIAGIFVFTDPAGFLWSPRRRDSRVAPVEQESPAA